LLARDFQLLADLGWTCYSSRSSAPGEHRLRRAGRAAVHAGCASGSSPADSRTPRRHPFPSRFELRDRCAGGRPCRQIVAGPDLEDSWRIWEETWRIWAHSPAHVETYLTSQDGFRTPSKDEKSCPNRPARRLFAQDLGPWAARTEGRHALSCNYTLVSRYFRRSGGVFRRPQPEGRRHTGLLGGYNRAGGHERAQGRPTCPLARDFQYS
jgi:hypothetical protein